MPPRRPRQIEVEWQFAVRDLAAVARALRTVPPAPPWSLRSAPSVAIRDTYLDTADWRLWRSGYALRVRRGDDHVEATLKALGRSRGGIARRREITERLAAARLTTLRAARGAVARHLRHVGADGARGPDGAALRRLFAVRTRRQRFLLRAHGRTVAEIALDRTLITAAGGRSRRLARLEVEVVGSGSPATMAGFVATLRRARHLTIAGRSKFEEGLALARLVPPRRR